MTFFRVEYSKKIKGQYIFSHQLRLLKHENHYWKVGFIALVLAATMHLLFIPLFFFLKLYVLACANVGSVLVYLYAIFGLGDKTLITHDDRVIGWLVYAELIGHAVLATYYLGLESGFHYYIYTLAILPFFTQRYALKTQLLRLFGIIAVSLFLNIHFREHQPLHGIARQYIFVLGNINLVLFLLISSGLVLLYSQHEQKHYIQLKNRSILDPLTGLYNRRFMVEYSEKFFTSNTANTVTPALLIIDIDHFKHVNDRYGHTLGDYVIQHTANMIRETVGKNAYTSRWGGEEFLALIPDITPDALETLCRNIVQIFHSHPLTTEKTKIDITITCGAALRNANESFSELFIRADTALYQGKVSGRDRYIIST